MTPLVNRLQARQSTSAKHLSEPGPGDDEIAEVLRAAVAVPEHGAIRPWRFLILRRADQERLSEAFVADLLADTPEADETAIAKRREGPLRSPLLIIVAASPREHPKVPEVEQVVTAGLAAYVIQASFADMGYGAVWMTGPPAYSDRIKAHLGLETGDHIVGFVHVGTRRPDMPQRRKDRPDADAFILTPPTP